MVLAEPYRFAHTVSATWTSTIITDSTALCMLTQSRRFVAVDWGFTLLIVVYAPPNVPILQMEDTMKEIKDAVVHFSFNRLPNMFLRDFNTKSVAQRSSRTDERGEHVTKWAAELDLQEGKARALDGKENLS